MSGAVLGVLTALKLGVRVPTLVGLPLAGRVVRQDATVWAARIPNPPGKLSVAPGARGWLLYLLAHFPEFRTLYYFRLASSGLTGTVLAKLLAVVYHPQHALEIHCDDVGPGLFFEHGFATIVIAKKIGAECWINQQVTIGYGKNGELPTLGDGAHIRAGAKVLGGVTVGEDAHVGANAVVTRDVPPRTIAVGVPARVLRTHEPRPRILA